jgi:hypothetical protein
MSLATYENTVLGDVIPSIDHQTQELATVLDHPTKERLMRTSQAFIDWNRRNTEAGYGFYGIEDGERRGSWKFENTPQH